MLGTRHAAFDPWNQILRQLSQANQQHVAVTEPYAVVVVIGVLYLPENTTVLVDLKRGTALPRSLADEAF